MVTSEFAVDSNMDDETEEREVKILAAGQHSRTRTKGNGKKSVTPSNR